MQVEHSILNKYFKKIPPAYESRLRQKETNEKKIFFKLLREAGSEFYLKAGKSVLVHFRHLSKKKVDKWLKKERSEIDRELAIRPLTDERIHKIRIMLKSLLYINSMKKKHSSQVKRLQALSSLLGKWHDFRMSIEHIEKVLGYQEISLEETIRMKKIIAQLNLQAVKLYEQISKVSFV